MTEVKPAPTATITDMDRFQRGVDYEVLRQDADHGDLTINAAGTLVQLLTQVATKQNFVVVYADGVRIPADVMKQLDAQFTVGGSATGGSSGGGSAGGPPSMGGGGTGSGGSGAIGASFTARGNLGTNGDQLREYLTRYAGANSEVSIARDFGLVTVRGSGVSLMRMREFLNDFSEAARRTVEVRAAMVEVTLRDEFAFGVSWERLLRNGTIGANLTGAATVSNPALSLTLTKTNTEAIVNMLQTVQLTLVPVLARVGEEKRFALGPNSALTGFEQIAQQSLMQALLQSGQTVILGGLRSSSEQDNSRGIPGLVKVAPNNISNNNTHREVVLILTATILPSLKTDTLFSESL